MVDKITSPVALFGNAFLAKSEEEAFSKPYSGEKGKEYRKLSVTLLFPTDSLTAEEKAFLKMVKAKAKEIETEEFGGSFKAKNPIIDTITDIGDSGIKEAYKLRLVTYAPIGKLPASLTVIDQKRNFVNDLNMFYAGCYGRCQFHLKSYNSNGNKGVHARLLAVQFAKDGDPISYAKLKGDVLDALEEYDALADNNDTDELGDL